MPGTRRPWRLSALLAAGLGASCAEPPPASYVHGAAAVQEAAAISVGKNSANEACTQQGQPNGGAYVYCGAWEQPSARISRAGSGSADGLMALATSSPWRSSLEVRYDCGAPSPTKVLDRYPAVSIPCTRKIGGWPQVALVAAVGDQIWAGDAVQPAVPPMERAIGVLSGVIQPEAAASTASTAGIEASRLAAQAFGSGDIGQYEDLMRLGANANQSSNYADSERAYRAASALQEKVLGRGNPATATAVTSEALQMSDQGRFTEAAGLFARAAPLANATDQKDLTAAPRLAHYRALDRLNQGKPDEALPLLDEAEAGYSRILPAQILKDSSDAGASAAVPRGVSLLEDRLRNAEFISDPVANAALYGAIETRRARAIALRLQGKFPESEAANHSAEMLAGMRGLSRPVIAARLYRTSAIIAQAAGRSGDALSELSQSSVAFARGLPGTKPYAVTSLLWAKSLMAESRPRDALDHCRVAREVLAQTQSGTTAVLMQPCILAYVDQAKKDPDHAQAILADMFEAAQQVQGSVTSAQIAQATARLTENARDPKVAALIRARADTTALLASLFEERDEAAAKGAVKPSSETADALDKRIHDAQASQAEADAALQAASPNYGQLVQTVVKAQDVLAVLHPGEAFVATILTEDSGTTFLLRDGVIAAAPIEGGTRKVAELVDRVRAAMEVDDTGTPKPFDTVAAHELYQAVFAGVADRMTGATALSVVPAGPLLSIPFGLLLTGPADASNLAQAPFLIRQVTVAHVPAPANFVTLRKLAASKGAQGWFGFGEFRPVTRAQAERSFPSAACAESAQLLSGLPLLPGARAELEVARKVEGAGPDAELLGAAFTEPGVLKASLKGYRILHFATHALLPTDIACQNEPAIVGSAPPGATDASKALLTASEVASMDLDADTVILSACNTGGPNGAAGESLSGLARSFFYAGARSLLVAHWAVNDRYAAYLVALTLSKARGQPGPNFAAALATAQRQILDEAKGDLANQAHPFYWAPLALIGEGSGGANAKVARL